MEYAFNDYIEKVSATSTIILIDYNEGNDLSEFIDKHFVVICEGNSGSSLSIAKKSIIEYMENKTLKQKIGMVAEFFAHLYFINKGFKQECLFRNLEEQSAKKGFDGVYSKEGHCWILESKARNCSKGVSHSLNINKAYNDLNLKFKGDTLKGVKNNPWRNAYNHASLRDVNTKEQLRQQLKTLSEDYINKKFYDSSAFNIIPCSTIFYDDLEVDCKRTKTISSIKKRIKSFKYKNIVCVAISSRIYNFFIKYLEE